MSLLDIYQPVLQVWDEDAGPKPEDAELHEAMVVGCHFGAIETLAVAMAFREYGTTQQEVRLALGEEHRNTISELIERGAVHRVPYPPRNSCVVYKIVLSKPRRQIQRKAIVQGSGAV